MGYRSVPAVLRPRQQVKLARGAKAKEHAMSQKLNTSIAVIGIDIGKNSFHIVGHDKRGAIMLQQKWSRGQVETRLANLPPCLIGMEACVGAHHLSRKPRMLGHDARLMPAKYVRSTGFFIRRRYPHFAGAADPPVESWWPHPRGSSFCRFLRDGSGFT
jgi:hypothetical protein